MPQTPDYRESTLAALEKWQVGDRVSLESLTAVKEIAQEVLLVPEVDFDDPIGIAAQAILNAVDEELPEAVNQLAAAIRKSMAPVVTILAVDDDPLAMAMIEYSLTSRKWRVQTADTGAGAIACFESVAFNLILLDYQLPDSDGKTLLARIRKGPRNATTPVLILTAETSAELSREFLAMGAQAVVTKPFSPTKLGDAVAAFLPVGR